MKRPSMKPGEWTSVRRYRHLALAAAAAASLLSTAPSAAHHSTATFDHDRNVEASGVLENVNWRNPHITMTLVTVENGQRVVWNIETNSVSSVTRIGLTRDILKSGAKVRVAGHPDKINKYSLWLNNVLLEDGREVLLGRESKPRWSKQTVGAVIEGGISKDAPQLGIFRTWTSEGRGDALWKGQTTFPLTPNAAAVRARYNPQTESPVLACKPKGMPLIMEQPYPMEFAQREGEIIMRLEEFDTVRHIAMSDAQRKRVLSQPASLLGNSVGRWEGTVLVVETSGITYTYFDKTGIRLSPAVKTVERFSATPDGSQLNYEMTVTDPATFTQPVVLGKHWSYRPNNRIQAYNCTN